VYCIYLAIAPILPRLIPGGAGAVLRQAMDIGFNVLAFAALWWFLYRITYGLEARLGAWTRASQHPN
jgi:hypothetical protein